MPIHKGSFGDKVVLAMFVTKNLPTYSNHVKNICTKVNNQINVISRFRKIVPTDVNCKLYKAFIVPYFRYCSAVWHFCGARNTCRNKLEHLNKRAHRIVLDEKSLHYQELLSKVNSSDLYSIRCQDIMKTVFKTIQFETLPKYIRGLFQMRNTEPATYEDQGNLLFHTSIQPLMVYTPSDELLQTCGTK